MNTRTASIVALYVASIVAANWLTSTVGLVPIWFGLMVTAGTFAAGAALILRDAVETLGGRLLAAFAIAVGVAASYALAQPMIAVASAVAFGVSELVDWAVFTPARRRTLPGAVLLSSVVAAPVDTVLFLSIAGFPVTPAAVAGQFIAKTAMAACVAYVLLARERRAA